MSRRWIFFDMLLILSLAVGCRGGMFTETAAPKTFADPPTNAVLPESDASEESLIEIVEELTELGDLDDETKRELMADLREAKPENWPYIVKHFRTMLAYRKQLAEREDSDGREEYLADQPPTMPLEESEHSTNLRTRNRDTQKLASAHRSDRNKRRLTARPRRTPPGNEEVDLPTHDYRTQAVVLSKPPLKLANQDQREVQPVSYQPAVANHLSWKQHLRSAVQDMKSAVPQDPASTDEVNEHMRLRLLQLLAGDQEAALMPVPGATPTQQDYWSQQLFAVSTFLDSESQPDNKRRANGSLTYLDQARAKLAELATLQVRNLTFVESVDGYGDYTLREEAKFRPGDSVTLYAEIENYTSKSTKQGHRTRLGTSFEIRDSSGKRVDSAQFPEVEDLCKTPRRDFHMQYTVTLPERIYPDDYELRLIVTDQQSQKIGQASLPLEIVE